jgi:uncharacterized membrane protein
MKLHLVAGACALVLAAHAPLAAQASFAQIPGAIACTDITPDGATVLVTNYQTGDVWLWTAAGGLQPIGLATSAEGLASDGMTVAAARPVGNSEEASRWTLAGNWQDLGGLTPGEIGCQPYISSSFDISGDGGTVVGLAWEGCIGRAFRWTQAGGMVKLPQLGPNSARANAISNDGLTIGGWDEDAFASRRPALWLPDGSEQILVGPGDVGEVHVLSDDASVAAGEHNGLAMYWTAATGLIDLGLLPGGFGFQQSAAFAMSGDGQMLGGYSGDGGPFGMGFLAFVWTPGSGMENLRDRLVAEGAVVPDDFRIGNVLGISDDGRTVVGWGEDLSGAFPEQRAYVATLAPQGWFVAGAGLAGAAGTPKLTGAGPRIPGTATVLSIKGGAPDAPVWVVGGLSRVDMPFKGGVLVPAPDALALMALDASGSLEVKFRWPAGLAAASSLYWQAWVGDASGPAGYAATNGLQSVTP